MNYIVHVYIIWTDWYTVNKKNNPHIHNIPTDFKNAYPLWDNTSDTGITTNGYTVKLKLLYLKSAGHGLSIIIIL